MLSVVLFGVMGRGGGNDGGSNEEGEGAVVRRVESASWGTVYVPHRIYMMTPLANHFIPWQKKHALRCNPDVSFV